MNKENTKAQKIFEGEEAKEDILHFLAEKYEFPIHVWFDEYDSSMEVGFSNSTPTGFEIKEEFCEKIKEWGFGIVYLNYTDGTQQHATQHGISKRGFLCGVNNIDRWNEEIALKYE